MRTIIPHITSFVLLVHAGFGCCWHHAHPLADGDASEHRAGEPVAHWHAPGPHCDHMLRNRQHDDGRDSSGDPSHKDDCAGDHCVFVRSDSTSVDQLPGGDTILSLFATIACDSVAGSPCNRTAAHRADQRAMELAPPVRAHLLFSVLLI